MLQGLEGLRQDNLVLQAHLEEAAAAVNQRHEEQLKLNQQITTLEKEVKHRLDNAERLRVLRTKLDKQLATLQ